MTADQQGAEHLEPCDLCGIRHLRNYTAGLDVDQWAVHLRTSSSSVDPGAVLPMLCEIRALRNELGIPNPISADDTVLT